MDAGLSIAEMYGLYLNLQRFQNFVMVLTPIACHFPFHSDSKLLSIISHIENLQTFAKSDPRLRKLVTLNIITLFEFLKQEPTPRNLKQ